MYCLSHACGRDFKLSTFRSVNGDALEPLMICHVIKSVPCRLDLGFHWRTLIKRLEDCCVG